MAAFDPEAKDENDTEFRFKVFPDAQHDTVQTVFADYACMGFTAGRDCQHSQDIALIKLQNELIRELIDRLQDYIETQEVLGGGEGSFSSNEQKQFVLNQKATLLLQL